MKTYGNIKFCDGCWYIEADPFVTMRLKRVFPKIADYVSCNIRLAATNENSYELRWFLQRYPMEVENAGLLESRANEYEKRQKDLNRITAPGYKPGEYELALPLRNYQATAVDLFLANGYLLIGDDVGLGKTACAIASFCEQKTRPALVVTLTHLCKQWRDEISKFSPAIRTHILKKGTPYKLPEFFGSGPDIIITSYSKLAGWREFLYGYVHAIVFDEIQELRRQESFKYHAAEHIASGCEYRLGLSATPVYNYGGEFWNISNVLNPDALGSKREFEIQWCGYGDRISEPKAFGAWLRDNHIMLRRTRKEVGRELPEVTKVVHTVDSDARELHKIKDNALELAKIIMTRSGLKKGEQFEAAGRFDSIMRQATGLAKAPFVADFVRMLVDSGEKVLLCGWHREVYSVWESRLKDLGVVYYTGSESPNQKEIAKKEFIDGNANILFMSLRSGLGLNDLQNICHVVVFGEMDWSPGIHNQCIGRIHRDGQDEPVVAYFLVSDDGADPIMMQVNGVKKQQQDGITDPDKPIFEEVRQDTGTIRKLAEDFIKRNEGAA